jgi:hypothetical protein
VHLLAVGGNHVEADDALAGRAVDPAVPAVSALQQVTAETGALAVAAREEQVLLLRVGHEQAAALARTDYGAGDFGVDVGVIEAADVEQDGAVAQVAGREAVPARNDADLEPVGFRVAKTRDDVAGIGGLHNHLRVALGHSLMPDGAPASRFVPVIVAEELPPSR